ncbi:MAG: hypothetical protein WC517_00905 [Patescibacteria group bacterium]
MGKILRFFSLIGEKIIFVGSRAKTLFQKIKDWVFRRQAEEARRAQLIKIIIRVVIVLLAVAVVILIIWYLVAKFWLKPAASGAEAAPIAEAKVYVVSVRACGDQCWDTGLFIDALVGQGIKIVDQKNYSIGGWWPFNQGDKLAEEFQISKLPTIIVEFTGQNQPDINNFFSPTLGSVINGKFVLTKILAPYYDSTEKKIKGSIKVTYLTDQSCAECYDVKKHETALKNLGVMTDDSETIDISSAAGQALINQYKITKVPTVLVSGEVSEYAVLTQAWGDVGIIATDGTYIFTDLDLMGDSYKNLTTGKVIKAVAPPVTAE